MANIELGWQVDGTIQPTESVKGMLKVIEEKDEKDNGTFWCWDGRVSFFGTLGLKCMLINTEPPLVRIYMYSDP